MRYGDTLCPRILRLRKPFQVETNASLIELEALFYQMKEGSRVNTVQLASRIMTAAKRNYYACEQETLVLVFALRKFQKYFLSKEPFVLFNGHRVLKCTLTKKQFHGRLAQRSDFLAEFKFQIQCRN